MFSDLISFIDYILELKLYTFGIKLVIKGKIFISKLFSQLL